MKNRRKHAPGFGYLQTQIEMKLSLKRPSIRAILVELYGRLNQTLSSDKKDGHHESTEGALVF